MDTEIIYIYLLNEGTDVWRPTQAEKVGEGLYRVFPTPNYDPEDEEWEFPPGTVVRCEVKTLRDREPRDVLVAVEKVEAWYVVTLLETNDAHGKFIADLLSFISSKVELQHVMIGDVEGAVGDLGRDGDFRYFTFDALLSLVREVLQFNWCDMLFYDNQADIPPGDLWNLEYPELIGATVMSLRVIDSGDVEVFTQSQELCESIARRYRNTRVYFGPLSAYTYPE